MGSAKTNWLLRAHFQGLRLIDDVAADDSRDVRPAALVPWIERRHKRQLNVKAKAMGVADCPVPGISGVRLAPATGILNAESSRPSGHFSGALFGHEIASARSRPTDADWQHGRPPVKSMNQFTKLTILIIEVAVRLCAICMGKKRKRLAFCAAQSH